jgi:hypothetical protein
MSCGTITMSFNVNLLKTINTHKECEFCVIFLVSFFEEFERHLVCFLRNRSHENNLSGILIEDFEGHPLYFTLSLKNTILFKKCSAHLEIVSFSSMPCGTTTLSFNVKLLKTINPQCCFFDEFLEVPTECKL